MLKQFFDKFCLKTTINENFLARAAENSARVGDPNDVKPDYSSILIQIGDRTIGFIQTIDVLEKDESENPLQYPIATAYRARFDRKAIPEFFTSQNLVHRTTQKFPFNIEVLGVEKLATLQNCWILAVSYAYIYENWIILDEMELEMEKFIPRWQR
jgi:hypothetical protein